MAFDYLGMLLDGTIVITPDTDIAPFSLTRNVVTGAAVINLKGTPAKGLCAVMNCPSKPTTYVDNMTCAIQESDLLGEPTALATWKAVANFPIVYAMTRELWVTATTAFVASDVGRILTATTDAASDGGVITYIAPELLAIGGVGKIVVSMSDANDDYTTAGDIVTATAGTGIGTQGAASILYPNGDGIPGMYVVRFTATKRYLRAAPVVSTGGSFGLVSIFLCDNAVWPIEHLV